MLEKEILHPYPLPHAQMAFKTKKEWHFHGQPRSMGSQHSVRRLSPAVGVTKETSWSGDEPQKWFLDNSKHSDLESRYRSGEERRAPSAVDASL